ncbi:MULTISPECIES: DUF3016 domain-containing protein [unclassified Janthinobacterium]|uniref:DUF3016 domain-containing protein n=1 Tax=unclassified Janthinobacterium TaxID=2610881 RepID=UPI0008F4C6F0|nr:MULTISPECIES: DUF3016 domain-containing protein [unclassified Janthinobacterium]APA71669.1 hypothetical protein YQ44_24035 [Janthinobacterium sp. 1_2014MBL_MicDiv]MDN2710929.1 DUF3016 domain-containing protein [Janthinobacterium sp. SUN118]
MQKKMTCALIAGVALLAGSAAWAGTEVNFKQPEKFTDLPYEQRDRESALKELAEHFDKLGKSLKPGQNLKIDVNDLDLAGRENPAMRSTQDIRIMNGRTDWPGMRLHYVLEEDGKVISSGDAALSDMAYMTRINPYSTGDKLRYEKLMIDDWFAKTFGAKAKAKAGK